MRYLLRRLALLAVVVEAAAFVVWRLGLLRTDGCTDACACALGASACRCGHVTCLLPGPEGAR